MRLPKDDYDYVKAATKATAMALRLVDKLFSKEKLAKSTVHGAKEFTALDPKIIAAIKSKLKTLMFIDLSYLETKLRYCCNNELLLFQYFQTSPFIRSHLSHAVICTSASSFEIYSLIELISVT